MEKLYDNGAKYKWDGSKYAGDWKSEDEDKDYYANYAKYKDLGKKQYNYNSELYKKFLEGGDHDSKSCHDGITAFVRTTKVNGCEYIWAANYLQYQKTSTTNKYIYDKWLTSIIFSCFTFVCAIGVAIFGLLLFLNKGGSGHTPIS